MLAERWGVKVPSEPLGLPKPVLGPLEGENRLERLNRCWLTFRQLLFVKGMNDYWSKRLETADAVRNGRQIDPSNVPQWMRPKDAEIQLSLPDCAPVYETDKLSPLSVSLLWDKKRKSDGYEDLQNALTKAEDHDVPKSRMALSCDSRLCKTGEIFRDAIRRMYNCKALGLDLRTATLAFYSKADSLEDKADILRDPWDEVQVIFSDANNPDFQIEVLLKVVDDPSITVYEANELPVGLEGPLNGAVVPDVAGAPGQPSLEAEALPITGSSERSPVDNILPFSSRAGERGIGAPPQPEKFGDDSEFYNYYGNFDVRSEQARREWQRKTLSRLTDNDMVAQVNFDRPSGQFSNAELLAIEDVKDHTRRNEVEAETQQSTKVWRPAPIFKCTIRANYLARWRRIMSTTPYIKRSPERTTGLGQPSISA